MSGVDVVSMTIFETVHACADCGAAQGTACTDACESAAVLHAEKVAAALDASVGAGQCCTYPLCPCPKGVAA